MENIIYNHDEFIRDYRLTRDEYFLLPLEERMEYCNRKFDYILDKVPKIGDVEYIHGGLVDCFNEFFNLNGCSTSIMDFGVEETEIRRESETKYTIPKGAGDKLDYHLALISEAKAQVFEDIATDYFIHQSYLLKSGRFLNDEELNASTLLATVKYAVLPEKYDEKYRLKIINAQMTSVMERINNGETVEINRELSPIYKEFLNQQYKVAEENRVLKVLKP